MWSKLDGLALLRRESVQVALLVVFGLTVYLPSHRSHWLRPAEGDERGQIDVSRRSLGHVVTTYQSGQNHPLYGILAHFTIRTLPVDELYAGRLPALLAGLLIPVAFYYTHRRWAGRPAAMLVSFVLVAADPLHYYASAARGYTLMVLFVLLANYLLLRYLRDGRPAVLAAYALTATAAAYSHLWGALILPAHAVFLAINARDHRFGARVSTTPFDADLPTLPKPLTAGLPKPKTSGRGGGSVWRPATTYLYAGTAIVVAALLIVLLYQPMLPEIRAMAGHRGEAPLGLVDKVLGLVSFRSWTTAAYVLLVPIALEGSARRFKHEWPDRAVWLHVAVILCVLSVSAVAQPANFYRRFLMVLLPSAAAVAAWAFAGALPDRRSLTPKLLPLPAAWLAGFALGVLVSNASMSSFMSWQYGAHTDALGRDHGYYYRNLPKSVESLGNDISSEIPVAALLLAVAAAVLVWSLGRPARSPRHDTLTAYVAVYLWTGLLLAALVPLLLGPDCTPQRPWLFEFHTIAVATICLLLWRYRDDRRLVHALRYGLLLAGFVLVFWQFGVERPHVDGSALLRVASLFPPVFMATYFLWPASPTC